MGVGDGILIREPNYEIKREFLQKSKNESIVFSAPFMKDKLIEYSSGLIGDYEVRADKNGFYLVPADGMALNSESYATIKYPDSFEGLIKMIHSGKSLFTLDGLLREGVWEIQKKDFSINPYKL